MPEDSQAQQTTLVGTTVGSYRIVERLGAGGMGEVYVGEHVRIVRRVAVKFLLPELTGNREVVDRFFAEARSTSSIRHPGIVEIFDCDVDVGGRAYIVMELLAGESLTARLERDGSFGSEVDRPLAVAEQMASALSAAHANGIIHRDLKPENVIVSDGDASAPSPFGVKILDFGIAKLLVRNEAIRSGRISITIPGTVLGTPRYMSPEQCRDASNVDHRTDVYSLGCILFEMFCGRPPFVAESFAELVAAQLQLDPPSIGTFRKQTPVRVESLVKRMLAKSREDRPATMEEVRIEIAALRTALEADAHPIAQTDPPAALPPPSRRALGPTLLVAGLLAAALLAVGSLAARLRHRDPSQSSRASASIPAAPLSPPASVTPRAERSTQAPPVAPSRGADLEGTPVVSSAATSNPPSLTRQGSEGVRRKDSPPAPRRRSQQRPPQSPDLSEEARKL